MLDLTDNSRETLNKKITLSFAVWELRWLRELMREVRYTDPNQDEEDFADDMVTTDHLCKRIEEYLEKAQELRWDCHQHRNELSVSDAHTVYHPEHGQLSHYEIHWDCILYYPIKFKDCAQAHKWIESGCIAEIQESMSKLEVGFSTKSFEWRNRR